MADKAVITGKEVLQKQKELEIQKKQFQESIEFEERNRRIKRYPAQISYLSCYLSRSHISTAEIN